MVVDVDKVEHAQVQFGRIVVSTVTQVTQLLSGG